MATADLIDRQAVLAICDAVIAASVEPGAVRLTASIMRAAVLAIVSPLSFHAAQSVPDSSLIQSATDAKETETTERVL